MSQAITDSGREFVSEKVIDDTSDFINEFAIGSATGSASVTDTKMDGEVYRAVGADSNLNILDTSKVGQIRFELTITEGVHVAAGTNINEFGVFTDSGTMVYHEIQDDEVTINENETILFRATVNLITNDTG